MRLLMRTGPRTNKFAVLVCVALAWTTGLARAQVAPVLAPPTSAPTQPAPASTQPAATRPAEAPTTAPAGDGRQIVGDWRLRLGRSTATYRLAADGGFSL